MINFIKRSKLSYMLYNLFQHKALKHNVSLYKKYNLSKRYFSSISSKDFKDLPPQNIQADLTKLRAAKGFDELPVASQESLLSFNDEGYSILRNFFSKEEVKNINSEIDQMIENGKVQFRYNNKKIMFAIHHSKIINDMGRNGRLSPLLDSLLDGKVELFQSINFVHEGSEQKTHSDSIHMTTYPLGGLLGVWIALEHIDESNGTLHYYPGSHKLPYYLNSDFDNEGNSWMLGKKTYTDYEHMIESKIQEANIPKKTVKAQPGDVLIWHANLFHGGEPHPDKSKTRKSMVFHYFKKDCICYHEVTQRPALVKS